jgi:hypothetical protein
MLTDIFKGRQFTVAFKAKEVKNILDLDQVEEEDLDGGNLSSLSTIYITFYNGVGLETVSIPLSRARQQPVFSLKFIRYIRAFGWYINEQGQYEVDMRDWDIADPVLEMPLAQFSAPMYMTLIQEFIRGSTVKGDKTDNDSVLKYDYLGDALIAFRNIVALKLSINITQLAIILQATKIASVQDNDYRPPAIKSEGVPRKFNDNMRFRDTGNLGGLQNNCQLSNVNTQLQGNDVTKGNQCITQIIVFQYAIVVSLVSLDSGTTNELLNQGHVHRRAELRQWHFQDRISYIPVPHVHFILTLFIDIPTKSTDIANELQGEHRLLTSTRQWDRHCL